MPSDSLKRIFTTDLLRTNVMNELIIIHHIASALKQLVTSRAKWRKKDMAEVQARAVNTSNEPLK